MLAVVMLEASSLRAQSHSHAARDSLSVMATGLVTRVAPALAGTPRTEAMVTQPMLILRGGKFGGSLNYAAMLNAERWTMPGGEPVAGIWGEGFVDRRHPHTVVHEVMLTAQRLVRGSRVSASLGRGIVSFGTDDPMVRPFTKYPANHHYAQILERIQVVGAIRLGPRLGLELSAFNGDEPAAPTALPRWQRFGDSRSARLTLWPVDHIEVQGSGARLRSPEFALGGGFDQRKWSASARWSPSSCRVRYVLAEWARNDDRYRAKPVAGYGTALVEALAVHRSVSVALRVERTSRHEEERLLDPFRTARPPSDLTILGITRWRLVTAQLAAALPAFGGMRGSLFVEATRAYSTPLSRPVLVDPANVSGANAAWHLTAGLRLGLGAMPVRVGRYGAAAGGPQTDVGMSMRHE